MNDPLYLEDSFVNLARVLTVFNEQNNQEQMGVVGKGRGGGVEGAHIVSKCKKDEFEGVVGVTNFRFIEEILDVPWP